MQKIITLVENGRIISKDSEVAEISNTFFMQATKELGIEPFNEPTFDNTFNNNTNSTDGAKSIGDMIRKHKNHSSIMKIKQMFQ